ncbi:MAG: homocysteine S-methyltransferase family protein [Sedimentisphaerales bacterium]|nr:homocysteine S-methyltransferase family protein [Sedimentisphaerales bacterium]
MSKISLRERIKRGIFLLDGAMGTELIARDVAVGTCNDYLNIESPDVVFDIHEAYIKAGSDAVLTNTFGANKYALARHGLADKTIEINKAGACIARRAAGQQKPVLSEVEGYVLGDIGPSGGFLQPLGDLKPRELKDAFAQQAEALLDGGVDGFIIETMTALDEVEIAIEAVKSVSDLPVFVSFSFDSIGDDFKTMMGVSVESAVSKTVSLGVDAVGFNCGTLKLDEYVKLAEKFVSVTKTFGRKVFILAEPNAGKPELVDGRAVYKVTPEDFAIAAEKIHSAGVNIIGGCCGTTQEHIAAVSKKLRVGNG